MIPSKNNKKWILVFLIYAIAVFVSLLATRLIIGSEIFGRNLFGFIVISLSTAFIPCIGGFLGRRIFFIADTIFILLGMLYMFYVVLGNTAPGWGDLSSIIGYLFIILFGIIIAFIAEVISYFITKNKN